MEYGEKVMEIMKTRKGKLFAVLLVLTVIFTFTGIAYGTSESMKSEEDLLVQSEEEQVTAVDGNLPATGGSDESQDSKTPEENGADAVIEDPDTDDPDADENIAPVPMVVTNGMVTFDVVESGQATVQYGGSDVTKAIEVDPADITKDAPFSFTVTPAEGYEIDTVSAVSTFNDRAKPFVPSTPIGGTEGETNDIPEGSVVYDELSDAMKAALADEGEKKLDALEPEVSTDQASAAFTYTIDDMAFFAGRDVTITVKMKEVEYDAWYKVVNALAAGHNVKLSQNITIGSVPEGADLNPTQQQQNKSQAVVNPDASDPAKTVILDLNGFTITAPGEGMADSAKSIILINKAKFEIKDTATAVPSITSTSESALTLNGENGANKDLIGKTGSFNGSNFVYYVTTSTPTSGGATKETTHEMALAIPDADKKAGSIVAGASIENLVEVAAGSDLKISGGIYTNTKGRALKNAGGTLDMQGGIIMKCSPDNLSGAGIYAEGGTTNIGGHSAIIGNSVNGSDENWNGGGISLKGGALKVSGQALIAGNKTSGDHKSPDERNYNPHGTGGGIYAVGGNIDLSGSCRIVGNESKYYGGGINAMSADINISEDAIISNNRTTFFNAIEANNQDWHYKTTGGGGIHIYTNSASTNSLNINGGKITANYSADGGGGILVPDVHTTFTMGVNGGYTPIVASNYAATSEGGGMYLRPAKGSVISSGYITNNATETPYDFGGGGIYVANEAEGVEVQYPVVTANTAQGFGGGAANCQNGITVSEKAAIFGNTAKGEKTSNTSVEVDHWMKDKLGIDVSMAQDFVGGKKSDIYANMLGGGYYNWAGYMSYQPQQYSEVTVGQPSSVGLKIKGIDFNASIAKSNMGAVIRYNSNGIDYIQIPIKNDTIMSLAQSNGLWREPMLDKIADALDGAYVDVNGWLDFSNGKDNADKTNNNTTSHLKGVASIYSGDKHPKDTIESSVKTNYKDWFSTTEEGIDFWYIRISLDTDASIQELDPRWSGYTKNIWSKHPTNAVDKDDKEWADRDRFYIPDVDNEVESWKSTTEGITPFEILEAAKTNTWNGKGNKPAGYEEVKWPIAQVEFPEDQNALARANRFMCLTADPSEKAQSDAIGMGTLFITGNYSATNGGGIGNNGTITIGENPNDPFTPPPSSVDYKNGDLIISKSFTGKFDPAISGSANATFRITQYASLEDVGKTALKEDIVTLAFSAEGSATYTWPEEVHAGNYFVIEELDIEGDNGDLVEPLINDRKLVLPVEYVLASTEYITDSNGNTVTVSHYVAKLSAEFKNAFNPESYMTSVINKYARGEDGNFVFAQTFTPAKAGNDQPESN